MYKFNGSRYKTRQKDWTESLGVSLLLTEYKTWLKTRFCFSGPKEVTSRKDLFKLPGYTGICITYCITSLVQYSTLQWGPLYLVNDLGHSIIAGKFWLLLSLQYHPYSRDRETTLCCVEWMDVIKLLYTCAHWPQNRLQRISSGVIQSQFSCILSNLPFGRFCVSFVMLDICPQ